MNERIRQLATEARLLTGWPVGEIEYQKFAELIVKECACIADDMKSLDVAKEIKQHFGVE